MQSESNEPTVEWMKTIPHETKIGVVIPLYSYWVDGTNTQLDWEVLSTFLTNLNSKNLKCYKVFVAESPRLSRNVQNVLIGQSKGGGMEVIDVDRHSTYGDYIKEGIDFILEQTDCDFVVIANPWIMLRGNSLDQLAEKLNMATSNLVCGVDLRKLKWGEYTDGIPADKFESFNFNPPMDAENSKELFGDFWGMTRSTAEMIKIDPDYRTIFYQAPDIRGMLFNLGLNVIASQYLPFYSFEVLWKEIESEEAFEADKQKFIAKWRFCPSEYESYEDMKL